MDKYKAIYKQGKVFVGGIVDAIFIGEEIITW